MASWLGTRTRTIGRPSSICSLKTRSGGMRGGRSERMRAGMSGRATLRTRVRFMRGSPWSIEANVGGPAGAQAAAIAEQFDEDFKGAARRVDDGADFLHARNVFFTGSIGR